MAGQAWQGRMWTSKLHSAAKARLSSCMTQSSYLQPRQSQYQEHFEVHEKVEKLVLITV